MRSFLAAILSLASGVSLAQELTPRAYWPAPKGTQVLTMGVLHHSGDTVPDPSLPLTGVDSRITTGYLDYLRTISLFGRSANFIVELPYSDGNTRVEHEEMGLLEQDYKGVGDISATFSINLLGAPTKSREEFAAMREAPSPIVGASLKVVAPTGNYDNDQLVNVGANRWAARAEVGYMLPLQRQWLIEVAAGAWMFGDNDDFLGLRREQDDVYTVQAHLVHRFSPGFWASLDLNGYRGGRSKIDGRRLDDLKRDSKYGATVVWPMARGQVLKFSYAAGSANDAEEDFDVFSLSYQRLF
ncbi:hypothetical protein A3709_08010 [Halioglobus sp. HI00S01]|uniref:transporter n=1 Tax=Halioglobus sp. HI00S01 TaxID=1822214 RepID=UPI0007C2DE62|nr:transporter [Halioglobus sp. HI00S01]KZX54945.1 hypothetical protein A3709_08010 [Halioglobus sp. HI00S01]